MGLVLDRATSRIVLMASEEGGTEIEEVAEKTPEKIKKAVIDPAVGTFKAIKPEKLHSLLIFQKSSWEKLLNLCLDYIKRLLRKTAQSPKSIRLL
nr:hypothetical protein P5658_19335 [Bacillus subtilis]